MSPCLQGLEVKQLRTNLTVEDLDVDGVIRSALGRKTGQPALKLLQLLNAFPERGCRVIFELIVVLVETSGCGGGRIPFEIGIEAIINEGGHRATSRFFRFLACTEDQ